MKFIYGHSKDGFKNSSYCAETILSFLKDVEKSGYVEIVKNDSISVIAKIKSRKRVKFNVQTDSVILSSKEISYVFAHNYLFVGDCSIDLNTLKCESVSLDLYV